MEGLLIRLMAIYGLAKDIHYKLKGKIFYGNHLLMDRITDNLLDFSDEIKENYFMYNGLNVPTSKDIYAQAAEMYLTVNTDDVFEKINNLAELIKSTVYALDEENRNNVYDVGDNDLLGRISSKLKNDYALLSRVLMGDDNVRN